MFVAAVTATTTSIHVYDKQEGRRRRVRATASVSGSHVSIMPQRAKNQYSGVVSCANIGCWAI